MKKRKSRFQVIYKDMVTGITYFVKRKVDDLHLGGHTIRVYDQNIRTRKMHPLCEWRPGYGTYTYRRGKWYPI